MNQVISQTLIDKVQSRDFVSEDFLNKQIWNIEQSFPEQAKGIVTKILSAFLSEQGFRTQIEASAVEHEIAKLSQFKELMPLLTKIPDQLLKVNILRVTPTEKLEVSNNYLAQLIYKKIQAENLVLKQVEEFVKIKSKRSGLLSKDDLSYIKPYLRQLQLSPNEITFINKSKKRHEKRSRWIRSAIFLITSFLLVMLFFTTSSMYKAQIQSQELLASKEREEALRILAEKNEQKAKKETIEASKQKETADSLRLREELLRVVAEEKTQEADSAKNAAITSAYRADSLRQVADFEKGEAQKARDKAYSNEQIAQKERQKAEEAKIHLDELNDIIVSRSASTKINELSQHQSLDKAILARIIYEKNDNSTEGDNLHPDVYNALFHAVKDMEKQTQFNRQKAHNGRINEIVYHPKENTFYSLGSDGQLINWQFDDEKRITAPHKTKRIDIKHYQNSVNHLLLHPNQSQIIFADIHRVSSFSLNGSNEQSSLIFQTKEEIKFLGTNKLGNMFYILDGNKIHQYKNNNVSSLFPKEKNYNSLSILSTEKGEKDYLFVNEIIGKQQQCSFLVSVQDHSTSLIFQGDTSLKKVTKMAIQVVMRENQQSFLLTIGSANGGLEIIEINQQGGIIKRKKNTLHQGDISAIKFSPSGKWMAAASLDGTISLWDLEQYTSANYHPIFIDDHAAWVTALAFSDDDQTLISGDKQGYIHIWSLDPSTYADRLCELIGETTSFEEKVQDSAFIGLYQKYFGSPSIPQSICNH